MISEVCESFSV